MAQDAAKADPERYRVEFENDQVRVLRINYGPHHKGVMHEHPASIAVWVTDAKATITTAGVTEEVDAKAGDVTWMDATKHQGENTSDQPFEVMTAVRGRGCRGHLCVTRPARNMLCRSRVALTTPMSSTKQNAPGPSPG
jgi:mannose-6-phosphate isomerase-like protein (cupin superfamily)